MTETVIRKITPGRPEASKTMSLGEAVDDYKDLIGHNKRLVARLKWAYIVSVIIIMLNVLASALGFFHWLMIPCALTLIASAFWALRLIRKLRNQIYGWEDVICHLKSKIREVDDHG